MTNLSVLNSSSSSLSCRGLQATSMKDALWHHLAGSRITRAFSSQWNTFPTEIFRITSLH